MSRMNIDGRQSGGLHPAAQNSTTREYDSVRPVEINDGNLNVALERGGFDGQPAHNTNALLNKGDVRDRSDVP